MTTATTTTPSVVEPQAKWSKEENEKVLLNSKAQLFLEGEKNTRKGGSRSENGGAKATTYRTKGCGTRGQ